jgi:lipopolysaccharide export system permease protein
MIRVLDRLVIRNFLRLFLLFVIGAPLLFILGDMVERVDRLLEGLTLSEVLLSYAYEFPQYVFWSFPIAGLMATVFTIQPMTVHREIMAAKAGGISFRRIVAPVIVLGVLVTGVGLYLSDLVPVAKERAAEIRGEREGRQGWAAQFVYLTDTGEALLARQLRVHDGRMSGLVILRRGEDVGTPTVHIWAEEASWTEAGGWVLRGGFIRELLPSGEERAERFQELAYDRLTERPEDLVQAIRDEDEMTRAELEALAARVIRSGGDAGRLQVKREQRLAIPVAALVIILFGAPLATSAKRGGAAVGIGLSLATTILYLVLLRLFGALGYAGLIDPVIAAWAPNLIFLVAGLFLMIRVRT